MLRRCRLGSGRNLAQEARFPDRKHYCVTYCNSRQSLGSVCGGLLYREAVKPAEEPQILVSVPDLAFGCLREGRGRLNL